MTPTLQRATPQDADACYGLLRSHAITLDVPLGSVSWDHPKAESLVHADAAAGRLYAVREGVTLAATFAIVEQASPRFASVQWAEPDAHAMYLHRLAVAAPLQRTGLGKWCVAHAEQIAVAAGATYLRLDALPEEARVMTFYRGLGFANRGIIRVESGDPRRPLVDLVCFEKRLDTADARSARAS